MTPGLAVTVTGSIGTITLDRPARRNAISQAMWAALPAELRALETDAGVRPYFGEDLVVS